MKIAKEFKFVKLTQAGVNEARRLQRDWKIPANIKYAALFSCGTLNMETFDGKCESICSLSFRKMFNDLEEHSLAGIEISGSPKIPFENIIKGMGGIQKRDQKDPSAIAGAVLFSFCLDSWRPVCSARGVRWERIT